MAQNSEAERKAAEKAAEQKAKEEAEQKAQQPAEQSAQQQPATLLQAAPLPYRMRGVSDPIVVPEIVTSTAKNGTVTASFKDS